MKMYRKINDKVSLDEFLESVNYLHDAILREFSLISRGYVDSDKKMYGDIEPSDARILFQTQSPNNPCVEIVFESVFEIRIVPDVPIMPVGEIADEKIIFFIGGYKQNDQTKVISRGMKYRILGTDCLGRNLINVKEIVIGDLKDAVFIKDNWIQCPECANIWEIKDEEEVTKCPDCKILLRIMK